MAKNPNWTIWKAAGEAIGKIAQAFKPAWSYAPKRTTQQYLEAFHTSPRLDALHVLASDVASTPVKAFDKRKYKLDPKNAEPVEHRILEVLDNPMPDHPEIDGYALAYATVVYRRVAGEAFWVIERDRRGLPAGLYIVPPTWVMSTPSTGMPYYLIQPMGNTSHAPLHVDPSDVVWFKDADVVNPYGRGRGRDEAIGDEIESDELAGKYGKNYFYNDATPPLLISVPNITQDDADKFKESWIQRFGGWIRARTPAILRGDNIKVEKLGDSAREMDFVESRRFLRDICNQHFSLPPEMMGILENSNRSTIDSAYYLWTKNTVSKELARYYSSINRQLVPRFGDDIILVPDNPVPEDKATQWAQMKEAVASGLATRNEARLLLGLPPDDVAGDVYLLPMSIVERKVGEEAPEPPEPPEPDDGEPVVEPKEPEEPEEPEEPPEPAEKGVVNKAMEPDRAKAYWDSFDAKASSGEEAFKAAVKKYAGKQDDEARRIFKAKLRDGLSYNAALDAMLAEVYGPDADAVLRDGLAPSWMNSMKDGMALASDTLGKPIAFDLLNPTFIKWIGDNGLSRAKLVNATSSKAVRKTLQEGIEAGEGINKLAHRISEVQGDLAGYRASRIARTETAASVNFGAYASYKAEGVESLEWIATRDGRTRTYENSDFDHIGADGEIIPIDGLFSISGENLQYPGDSEHGASPGNTINCRCSVAPVVKLE